jgi:microcin C transport system permease protein
MGAVANWKRMRTNPLNRRRWHQFKANRRGYWSLWIFLVLFGVSLMAELIANDKPIVVHYQQQWFVPFMMDYSEQDFGGDLDITPDYGDPYIQDLILRDGWMIWPVVRFNYKSINYGLTEPAPSPPSRINWFGTDDQGRDVFARLLYGFRISVLFALVLSVLSSMIGVFAGALQGYFGGRIDLLGQRFIEIWSGMPQLFLLIIFSSLIRPGFWWLLLILLLFSWMALVDVVRAEFLRGRNLEYVKAARALGLPDSTIMFRHILPNAMIATLTFMPFIFIGGLTALTGLDYLGFGLPPGSPSLGEMVAQGKNNLHAPWLGVTAFVSMSGVLILLVFMGEGARDAFDPRGRWS